MSFLPGSVILQCVCADELEFLSLQFFKFPLCSWASKALSLCFSPLGRRFFSSSSFFSFSLTCVFSRRVCLGRWWTKELFYRSKRGIYDPSPRSMMLVIWAPHALFSLGAVQGRARARAAEEPGPAALTDMKNSQSLVSHLLLPSSFHYLFFSISSSYWFCLLQSIIINANSKHLSLSCYW